MSGGKRARVDFRKRGGGANKRIDPARKGGGVEINQLRFPRQYQELTWGPGGHSTLGKAPKGKNNLRTLSLTTRG